MGKRGPKPAPATVLRARGSWRAGERADQESVYAGAPEMPAVLTGEAKKLWSRVVPQLAAADIARNIDSEALAGLCMAWQQACESSKQLAATGYVLESERGVSTMNPLVTVRDKALSMFLRYAAEFGFTPASRNRVEGKAVEKPEASDGKPKLSDFVRFPKVG